MVRQNRMRHREAVTAFLLSIQQVGFRTDVAFQRHDDFFTDRVDRWIRHLSKQLMEIIVQHARLIAQTRQSRIVAHRANRILIRLDQRQQHEVHGFGGVTERLHTAEKFLTG